MNQQLPDSSPAPALINYICALTLPHCKPLWRPVLKRKKFLGDLDAGFGAIPLTRLPGRTDISANDLSGRYWLRPDNSYEEVTREDFVDEAAFTELVPEFKGTYFETIHKALCDRFAIGRMRILSKGIYNCNSWHRDPVHACIFLSLPIQARYLWSIIMSPTCQQMGLSISPIQEGIILP